MTAGDPLSRFDEVFGGRPTFIAVAPGRVNLLGEHVDYVGGCVLPFAIQLQTIVAASITPTSTMLEVYSEHSRERVSVCGNAPLDPPLGGETRRGRWGAYVRGMVACLNAAGVRIPGGSIWIGGDLPVGGGLSSSAALCVAVGMVLARLADAEIDPTQLALMVQRVEREHAGTPCGIMDPYAIVHARAGCVLHLDCLALSHTHVPLDLPGCDLLAIPSGVRHVLADGAYEQRVAACERGLRAIQALRPGVATWRDVTADDVSAATTSGRLDVVDARRARHVVSEMRRVESAVDALRNRDAGRLGALLNECQDSLRDDYEVSCERVDAIVARLRQMRGVLGARMVGGGFGGVVLALLDKAAAGTIAARIERDVLGPLGVAERIRSLRPCGGAVVQTVDDYLASASSES